ncbi:MAG: hypothetical protein IPL95_17535 [Saprospiraceae bacterium]|nr:hypothetical protein [Saprospiraceae bacterium]
MKKISEEDIDIAIGEIEANGITEEMIEAFKSSQPIVFAYLFSDSFDLSTQDEKEYLLYLVMVAWKAIFKVHPEMNEVEEEEIGESEEKNWELINNVSATKFRDRLTILFENSNQEDLLAFAEDMLTELEEEETTEKEIVTKEGRELLFVAYKSIIDAMEMAN